MDALFMHYSGIIVLIRYEKILFKKKSEKRPSRVSM